MGTAENTDEICRPMYDSLIQKKVKKSWPVDLIDG
jgi:hypothetical protein